MQTSRVQQRGQITLPKEVREEAAISPGDLVSFRVLGEHQIVIEVIPVRPLQYFWERFGTDEPYDDRAIREDWQREAAADVIRD